MKKIVCLLLALVLIFALVGCRTSNRPYRRYAAPYGTDNRTYTTSDGVYRSTVRPRTITPGDAPLYDGYRAGPRTTTGKTAVPSPAAPLPTTTSPAPRTTVTPGRTNKSFNVPS